jgi:hypothetical protein
MAHTKAPAKKGAAAKSRASSKKTPPKSKGVTKRTAAPKPKGKAKAKASSKRNTASKPATLGDALHYAGDPLSADMVHATAEVVGKSAALPKAWKQALKDPIMSKIVDWKSAVEDYRTAKRVLADRHNDFRASIAPFIQ